MIRRAGMISSYTFTLLMLCACIGDSTMVVRGHIVDANNLDKQDCLMTLHLANDDRAIETVHIAGVFREHFVVSPSQRTYYFEIECGTSKKWRGKNFEYPDAEMKKNGLDLGSIAIDR